MRKHLPALAAATLSLAGFGGLTFFAVPSAVAIAGWFALGTVVAGYAGSLLYNYNFRLDTYAVGLCSGALIAGAAVKLAQHETSETKPSHEVRQAFTRVTSFNGSELGVAFRSRLSLKDNAMDTLPSAVSSVRSIPAISPKRAL
jgi:hypothetical protein